MIQIITDSTCDLSAEKAAELGLKVLPLTVQFGEEAFLDGVEMTPAQFYERLAASGDVLPTTSQLNPAAFLEPFQSALDQGFDVVGIFLSSELSGTYQSAVMAKEMIGSDRIYLVDSRTVTFPLALLLSEAARLRDEGLDAAELARQVTALAGRIRLMAVLDTLKYLKLGGRISATTAFVGGALGITPIIGIRDGKVESLGKSRGRKAGLRWMHDQLAKEPIDTSLGVSFGHSNCPDVMAECRNVFAADIADAPRVLQCDIGSVIGTHAGPGATGIAYFAKV